MRMHQKTASKNWKQNLTNLKREIDKSTIKSWKFQYPPSATNRTTRKRNSKDADDPNKINQQDLTDINSTPNQQQQNTQFFFQGPVENSLEEIISWALKQPSQIFKN